MAWNLYLAIPPAPVKRLRSNSPKGDRVPRRRTAYPKRGEGYWIDRNKKFHYSFPSYT